MHLGFNNSLTSNLNIEIIGPPGTGKTFRVVRPILSQLAGNFLVTDPKGELSQQTGQYMEDNGYGVFVINCQSEQQMMQSHKFNPFRYLSCESDILGLCEILFKATTDADASKGDQFFEDMAQILLTCIFYLMYYTYPKELQNWAEFVKLIDSTAVKADPKTGAIDLSDPGCIMNIYSQANEEWKATHDGAELKGFRDIEKIYSGAHETASSIVSSLDSHCKYMKLECVVSLLSDDDLDFINTFGRAHKTKRSPTGKYILYLVTSENVHYFDWIPSMVYSLFIGKLYHLTETDESLHLTLPYHLTFLMDEFYNTTLPDSIVGLSSTMRSRGISLIPIVQNLQQLKDKFPKNDQDKNFRSNMCMTLVLGGPEMDSCKTLEEEFGKMTIHKQTTGLTRGGQGSRSENEDVMERPLFLANDIHNMQKDGPVAIKVKGTDPLWVQKTRFEKSPLMPLLTRKTPYVPHLKPDLGLKKYDRGKSPAEQMPELLIGDEAEKFLKECREEGIQVVKITPSDIDAMSVLGREGKEIGGDDTTDAFWERIRANSERTVKEKRNRVLDLDAYNERQFKTVQRLRNDGFTAEQIHGLEPLIFKDMEYDEIRVYFGPHMAVREIADFAGRMACVAG